ncbi:polysaccharide deacetylase [Streptomyces sp. CC53]|uniref:polysaccharide deacetylase family protein n=1 Tax=unclassified Streptomyces TaxID=2593676 RepID=UPI0008DDAF93|nr:MULTISPECIES: polysaccharide deacetylase family protein [unclassified Streptomyces]OII60405.1 polysaccharide deacetylase [Streptomyces sp. CC53]OII70488.1 polysaccharide deacetylase [Streptomyces sp. CC77]
MTGRTPPPWIAMYHSVDDDRDDPYQVTVTPGRLDAQLRWLRARGLRGVGVRELLDATARGAARDLVGLTFDDGYADFLHQAVPLLHRHGCTATVFVLPGRLAEDNAWDELGPRKPLLSAPDLRRCVDAGMEVASHGSRHTHLTRADDATLRAEVHGSREQLRALTGRAPAGFCYPYGEVDARVAAAVRDAGYAYGCAIDPDADLAGVLALPRVHIGQRDTGWRLAAKRRLHRLRRRTPASLAPAPVAVS